LTNVFLFVINSIEVGPVSEERNAVENRSGPATVTGDESSSKAIAFFLIFISVGIFLLCQTQQRQYSDDPAV